MRLIDADKLIVYLNDYALTEAPDVRESIGERRISKATYNVIQNCIKAVEERPTAFEVDKVVERLEDYLFEKYCIENDSEIEDIVKGDVACNLAWIPVSERTPEDGDCRFYMCLVENHIEDVPMMCQFEEEAGFGFYKDIYDPVSLGFVDTEFDTMEELGYEKVMYWMQLPKPPEESEEENE